MFTFSSVGLSASLAVAFFMLSNTKTLFLSSTVTLLTSAWVATSLTSRACAVANSALAFSIADAVFSVTPALAIAVWRRTIAALKLALLTFTGVVVETSLLAVTKLLFAVSEVAFTAVSLFANALPPPKNANPAAINTDAVPTLNFLIP